jgi:predicted RNase H-like HicB family nuclease
MLSVAVLPAFCAFYGGSSVVSRVSRLPVAGLAVEQGRALWSIVGMRIRALVHQAEEGGFWAEVPALPGCVTQGDSMAEFRMNLREAIALWIEAGDANRPSKRPEKVLERAV